MLSVPNIFPFAVALQYYELQNFDFRETLFFISTFQFNIIKETKRELLLDLAVPNLLNCLTLKKSEYAV